MLDPGQGRRRRAGGRLRAVAVYAATAPVRIDGGARREWVGGGGIRRGWRVQGLADDAARWELRHEMKKRM